VQFRRVAATDGVHLGVGVGLVDGNELGTEAEADDGDADLLVGWHDRDFLAVWMLLDVSGSIGGEEANGQKGRDDSRWVRDRPAIHGRPVQPAAIRTYPATTAR